jgi:hypothetical protein
VLVSDQPVDLDGLDDAPVPDADLEVDAVPEPVRIDRWVWRLPQDRPPILINQVTSPMVLAGKRKKARSQLANHLINVFHPWGWDLVEVEVVWFRGDNRGSDPDGLAPTLKPALDAMVDAGVLPDDKARHVHRVCERIVNGAEDPHRHRGSRVVIVVHRLERPEGSA